MQITKIQNISKFNFQYKNNPTKFNSVNFKGQDTFEHSIADDIVVSKKYYRGEKEFDSSLFMQQGQTLFINERGTYTPYYACLKECNCKGEIIRQTSFNNGVKYIVDNYKNGQIVQQDRYEDVFGSISKCAKKTGVVKYEASNEAGKKPLASFVITRNYGKNWKNQPTIVMRKNSKNDSLFIYFATPSDTKRGEIEVDYKNKDKTCHFQSPICDEKDYFLNISSLDSVNETAFLALTELKETIESQEFKADFGDNSLFNSELNKAIEFLSSKLNED